jgi:hypothetical protein
MTFTADPLTLAVALGLLAPDVLDPTPTRRPRPRRTRPLRVMLRRLG